MSDIYKSKLSSNSSLVYDIRQSLSLHKTAGLRSQSDVYFNQLWVSAVWCNKSFPFKGDG